MNINPNNLEEFSPEKIAQVIFTGEPKDPCTHQILAHQNGSDITYIFEILTNILVEGINIFSNGLNNIDFSNFTEEHISIMNPWFNSLGFKLKVDVFNKGDDDYQDYYCKVVIRDSTNENFFDFKGITKPYHFFLNGEYLDENREKENLKDLHAIIINGDVIYNFSFDLYSFT